MPVDRPRKFESAIIPKNKQMDPRLKEDMAILHLAGLSKRTLALLMHSVSPQIKVLPSCGASSLSAFMTIGVYDSMVLLLSKIHGRDGTL